MNIAPKSAPRPTIESGKSRMEGLDPADPHPAEEGDPYNNRSPSEKQAPIKDNGPNPAHDDGTAPPRSDNAKP